MATRLQKIIWSFLCGAALGIGATGCYDSDEPGDMYGPPPDVSTDDGTDADADAVDAADTSEAVIAYGPAPMYGPAIDP